MSEWLWQARTGRRNYALYLSNSNVQIKVVFSKGGRKFGRKQSVSHRSDTLGSNFDDVEWIKEARKSNRDRLSVRTSVRLSEKSGGREETKRQKKEGRSSRRHKWNNGRRLQAVGGQASIQAGPFRLVWVFLHKFIFLGDSQKTRSCRNSKFQRREKIKYNV